MKLTPSRRELLLGAGCCLLSRVALAAPLSRIRRIRLENTHTGESFDGPYRDAEGPIPSDVEELQHFFRDFHVDKMGPVDIGALDILTDVMALTGLEKASILSAYRTPETNAKLMRTTFGVAENSEHIGGHALDVTFEGKLVQAKNAALFLKQGGVGWYPSSHFIHIDSGPVRHWELDGHGFDHLVAGRKSGGQPVKARLARLHARAKRDFLARR
jgi:uncharacterized protein YcbK (DUF882 family)